MEIESSNIYGGSLILSRLIDKDYDSIGNELIYFISFQEFDKYVRYISYGIPRKSIIDEICNDIESINGNFTHKIIPGNIRRWITTNFSYAYGLITPEDE